MIHSQLKYAAGAAALWLGAASASLAFESSAEHAIIVDFDTGVVLYEKAADERAGPASMTKLMTAYLIFERLASGALAPKDEFTVSENAWRKGGAATGGSTTFLKIGEKITVSDLLRGIVIQSGNDACIVAAENIAGSEEAFVDLMNQRARELGLEDTNFVNSYGWPDPEHYMSMRDLADLSRAIIRDFPELYTLYEEREFTWNGIRQYNRNPLLGAFEGADGLKTGHTSDSGYGLAASAEQRGERRIVVFNGMESEAARAREAERLMRAAFREFDVVTAVTEGQEVARAKIWMGETQSVPLVAAADLHAPFTVGRRSAMKVEAVFDAPLKAPIAKGQVVGKIVTSGSGTSSAEVPLLAAADVPRKGLFGRALAALNSLIVGDHA